MRQALQAEVHNLDVEKERTEDIVPGGSTVEIMTGQDSVPQISWNYSEFSVSYRSLSKEVCVGQYYLRLLLETGNSGRAQDFPLRDPVAFFRALYHRFLCDADTGLTDVFSGNIMFPANYEGSGEFYVAKKTRTIASTFVPVIDLSCNQLTSVVPTQIGNLRGITGLHLSNNLLTSHNSRKF